MAFFTSLEQAQRHLFKMKKLLRLLVVLTTIITQQLPAANHSAKRFSPDHTSSQDAEKYYTVNFKDDTTGRYPAHVMERLPMVQAIKDLWKDKDGPVDDTDQCIYLRDCSKKDFDALVPFLTPLSGIVPTEDQLLDAISAAHTINGPLPEVTARFPALLLNAVTAYRLPDDIHTPAEAYTNTKNHTALFKKFTNTHAQMFIEKVKKSRLCQTQFWPTLPLYACYLVYGMRNGQTLDAFPVPNYTTDTPDIGPFPVSITDLKNHNALPNLESDTLHLAGKGLTSLEGLSHVPKLKILDLKYNKLATIPAHTFHGVPNVQSLSLESNKLTTIPTDALAAAPNLQQLYLGTNHIPSVPAHAFQGLTQLQELCLRINDITSLDPAAFAGLTSLRNLGLEYNYLQALPVGVFHPLPNLHTLDLTYAYKYSNTPLALPAGVFQGLTNLRTLILHRNGLTAVPTDALTDTPNLEKLDLSRNSIASIGPRACAVLTKLQRLDLTAQTKNNSPIYTISTDDAAFEGLPTTCNIQLPERPVAPTPSTWNGWLQ